MSAVAVPMMPVDEARRLTERIRLTALSVRDGMEKVQSLVEQAREGNAHLALGYASWTAYLADTLGSEPLRLPRDQRQELVGYLAGEGMSTRAIAPIVGVTHPTVQSDIRSGGRNLPPEPAVEVVEATPEEWARIEAKAAREGYDARTGEVLDDQPAPKITGLDGKAYSRPASAPTTRRKALPDTARDAGWELRRAVERLERIARTLARKWKDVGGEWHASEVEVFLTQGPHFPPAVVLYELGDQDYEVRLTPDEARRVARALLEGVAAIESLPEDHGVRLAAWCAWPVD